MKNDMSKMVQKLSYILNDNDMPDDLKNMLNNYISSTSSSNNNSSFNSNNNVKNNNNSKNSNRNSSFPNFEEFTSSFNTNNPNNSSYSSDSSNSSQSDNSSNPFSNIDMGTILKMKQVMENMNQKKNDPRSNLLQSLKPYLRPTRKQKIDQYIQLFNMGSIMENFKSTGGEKTK